MSQSKILSASLLVAGTAIGAGMLALPVSTAQGGFLPAIFVYIVCWLFSLLTGLLLLEACFWLPKDSNLVSLSYHLLGKKGKIFSWILYLFFFYCLSIAYVAGGGGFVLALVGKISPSLAMLIFVVIFAPAVYAGTRAVDRLNFILMIGLIGSFIVFVLIGFGKVDVDLLKHIQWPKAVLALPVVLTSFSYQGIIPSMRNYFHKDPKAVRKVIIIGSTVPLFVYILWELLILGIIPLEGAHGLISAKAQGLTGVIPLKHFSHSPYVYAAGQAFAFCALTTSFLGVTLGLFDFLADGLKYEKKGGKKIFLCALVFIPPTLIAIIYPNIFLKALSYAGGIGGILLLGLLPILMVWSGRYYKKLSATHQQVGGGRLILFCLALFVFFELFVEIASEFWIF